jgi:hypothetical protein
MSYEYQPCASEVPPKNYPNKKTGEQMNTHKKTIKSIKIRLTPTKGRWYYD